MTQAKKSTTTRMKKAGSAVAPARRTKGDGQVSAEQRYRMIQEAAFLRAEKAGFRGDAVEHWLSAEQEIEQRLSPR